MCRRKDYFRDLCKAYPLQKQLQQALEMKMKRSSADETVQKQYQAVLKQVEWICLCRTTLMEYDKKILHTNIICPYGHYKDVFKTIVLY